MPRFEKALLFFIAAHFLLPNYAWCIPPQLRAANNFVVNHPYLSKNSFSFKCTIDNSENANLVYYEPVGNGSKALINFLSFHADGTLRLGPKRILENHWEYSLHENESKIISDAHGNTHLIMRDDKRTIEIIKYVYVMVDSVGILKKRIEIERSFTLSSMRILEDGSLLAHGGFGRFRAPDSEIVLMLKRDSDKFESFSFETPELGLGYRTSNIGAKIFPLGDDNILLVGAHSSPYMGKTIVRKTIINLKSKGIVNAEIYDAREVWSVMYYNKIPNMNFMNYIFPLENRIAYLCGLPSLANPYVPSDSMCVILFDSKGNLIKSEARESFRMNTEMLSSFSGKDFLIRNNRDAFGQIKFNAEYRLSLFGVISFRDFPQIIVDDGLR